MALRVAGLHVLLVSALPVQTPGNHPAAEHSSAGEAFVLLSSTDITQVPSHYSWMNGEIQRHRNSMSSLASMGLVLKFLKPVSPGILNP